MLFQIQGEIYFLICEFFLNYTSTNEICHCVQSEVNFLGKLSHPNIVTLLGYCCEDKELLLVYEFMRRGSLENHLFHSKGLD